MPGIRTCIHCTDISENKLMLGALTLRKIRVFTLLSQTLPETNIFIFREQNSPKLNNFIYAKTLPKITTQILKPHENNLFAAGRPVSLLCLFSPNILTFYAVSDSKDL
jgi:hypothetical protein